MTATIVATLIGAAHVNWLFVLILLGPSLLVLGILAVTWRSRVRQMREQDEKRRLNEDSKRSGQGGPRGGGAKRRRP